MSEESPSWSDDLLTGDVEIDAQHRALYHKVLRIRVACDLGRGADEVGHAIKFLAEYAADHFAAEDKRMASVAYPYIATHMTEHADFLMRLTEFEARFEGSEDKREVARAVSNFASSWFMRHVKLVDRPLMEFLRGQRK